MNSLKTVVLFIPFVLFSLLVHVTGGGWAALVGLVAAVAVVVATARGGIKTLPVIQAAILLVMSVAGAVGDTEAGAFVVRYGPAIAALVMGVFMLATAASRSPFTAQTARDWVPSRLWHDPRFIAVNRRTSTAWRVAVLLLGICHLVGGTLTAGSSLPLLLTANWGLPIVAICGAQVYSQHTIKHAKTTMGQAHLDAGTAVA